MEEELIERYLKGELEGHELAEFEARLESEREFRNSVELQGAIMEGFANKKLADFRKGMEKLESNFREKEPMVSRPGFTKGLWLVAASVVIIAVAIQIFSRDSIVDDYYEAYPNYIFPAERGESTGDELMQAFSAYDQGNYKGSLELLSGLEETDTVMFYRSQCMIAIRDLEGARPQLEVLIEDSSGLFFEQSLWYLSLVYLEQNQEQKAAGLLRRLIDRDGYNSDKARELIP